MLVNLLNTQIQQAPGTTKTEVKGSLFELGNVYNAEDGIASIGNVGKNYVHATGFANAGTTVFTNLVSTDIQTAPGTLKREVKGSFFNLHDMTNAKDGIMSVGNVGNNYVYGNHVTNQGTAVFTLI